MLGYSNASTSNEDYQISTLAADILINNASALTADHLATIAKRAVQGKETVAVLSLRVLASAPVVASPEVLDHLVKLLSFSNAATRQGDQQVKSFASELLIKNLPHLGSDQLSAIAQKAASSGQDTAEYSLKVLSLAPSIDQKTQGILASMLTYNHGSTQLADQRILALASEILQHAPVVREIRPQP